MGNVLIVDDDISILNLLEKTFSQEGFNVMVTIDPFEVVSLYKNKKVDLIILDVFMPKKDGYEVFNDIRKEDIDVPIVFITRNDLANDKITAFKHGADDYIVKPFNIDEVVERVKRILYRVNRIKESTIFDFLTGAYTKQYFFDRIKGLQENYKRNKRIFTVAFIDIDKYKYVNDTYGHLVGDTILKEFSKEIKENIRQFDQLFRFGGDEFLLLFPETDSQTAYNVLERIRVLFCNKLFTNNYNGEKINITISAGIKSIENENETIEDILECADKALYKSKEQGRNKISIYSNDSLNSININKKKILIVDDANIIINLITTRLQHLNYEFSFANDGEAAIIKSKIIKPDLIILDLMLPKINGFEVCKEIRNSKETKDTKIIVLSSLSKKEDILKCFELGIDDYVVKPLSIEKLEKRVKKVLS